MASIYDNSFSQNENIITPFKSKNSKHVYHQYTIKVLPSLREKLISYLNSFEFYDLLSITII